MKITDHALNVLTARTFKGIGEAWLNNNLTTKIPYEAIVELIAAKDASVTEQAFLEMKARLERLIENLGDSCDGVVAIGDDNYPTLRRELKKKGDIPSFLFYKGDLDLLSPDNYNVAVIGVLNPDKETEADEKQVVEQFIKKHDATIVSGLANGCDSISHRKALVLNARTVAILPSPLNNILPAQNIGLAREIVENQGLLITEYLTSPSPANFREQASRYVKRDRLQALFSDLVVLSASYSKTSLDPNNPKPDSGSRHAMEKAKEYDIKRAVIYNEDYQNNPKYDLNRQIIKEDGPQAIVINPKDIENSLPSNLKESNGRLSTPEQVGLGF